MSWVCYNISVHVNAAKSYGTHNTRASLFLSNMNASIWTPKMTSDEAIAVRSATRLIPCEPCAAPTPVPVPVACDEADVEDADADVVDIMKLEYGSWIIESNIVL